MEQQKSQDNPYLRALEAGPKLWETGQLRRTKMHVSCLAESIDNKNALTPALRELLEASITLQTTSTKILAAYLKRSPTTIRKEFQQILTILGAQDINLVVHTTEDEDFLSKQKLSDSNKTLSY
jgi:hypothetical protein